MRTINLLCTLVFICISLGANAQKGKQKSPSKSITTVYSMTLKTDFEDFAGKYNLDEYFIGSGKTVKPNDGFAMVYNKKHDLIILTSSENMKEINHFDGIQSQDGTVETVNFNIECAGCFDTPNSCNPSLTQAGGNGASVGCSNPCQYCSIWIYVPSKAAAQIETSEGNFGF